MYIYINFNNYFHELKKLAVTSYTHTAHVLLHHKLNPIISNKIL